MTTGLGNVLEAAVVESAKFVVADQTAAREPAVEAKAMPVLSSLGVNSTVIPTIGNDVTRSISNASPNFA